MDIKIYDMTLRDGLQSIKPYPLEIKLRCIDEIFKNNLYYVDYGSVIKENTNKQMLHSDKILEYIKTEFPNTKTIYGILIPDINLLSYDTIQKNNAFSLLCTVDDNYSFNNFNKNSEDNFIDVLDMLETIITFNKKIKKIRIYIACSFNKNNSYKNKLYNYTSSIIDLVKKYNINSDIIDIVYADTFNEINVNILFDVLSLFSSERKKYIGLHLHCGNNFYNLINLAIKMKIYKIDTGLCDIGSCNNVKNKDTNYISTIKLLKFLNKTDTNIKLLEETENKLNKILNLT